MLVWHNKDCKISEDKMTANGLLCPNVLQSEREYVKLAKVGQERSDGLLKSQGVPCGTHESSNDKHPR